ncbi:MAG: isoprenylcysteine carboxylmethyltransferase family protein [Croceibacterium sp.]
MSFYFKIAIGLWAAWLVSWQAAALWRSKPTVQAPRRDYRLLFVAIALGFFFMFNGIPRLMWPTLWPVTPVLGWSMEAVIVIGIAFAWWARVHLGKLWSGGIERMAEHRVVDTGPYALVRHPIYTGMILAAIGIAVIRATPWALLGAGLMALGFALKAKVEERFLEGEIGGYDAYRARVPMIVPFLPTRS